MSFASSFMTELEKLGAVPSFRSLNLSPEDRKELAGLLRPMRPGLENTKILAHRTYEALRELPPEKRSAGIRWLRESGFRTTTGGVDDTAINRWLKPVFEARAKRAGMSVDQYHNYMVHHEKVPAYRPMKFPTGLKYGLGIGIPVAAAGGIAAALLSRRKKKTGGRR